MVWLSGHEWRFRLKKNNLLLLFFTILGGIIGEVFGAYVPFLNYGEAVGFSPVKIDLSLIQLTLGFSMKLSLSGILGLLLGAFLFKKLV
jgi:hypothetical protein